MVDIADLCQLGAYIEPIDISLLIISDFELKNGSGFNLYVLIEVAGFELMVCRL